MVRDAGGPPDTAPAIQPWPVKSQRGDVPRDHPGLSVGWGRERCPPWEMGQGFPEEGLRAGPGRRYRRWTGEMV